VGEIERQILNPQASAADYMGGWEPTQDDLDSFLLDPYTFILSTLREQDERARGVARRIMSEVVRPVWLAIHRRIEQLPTLMQPAVVDAKFLAEMKGIVGFTSRLDYVTRNLSEAELRKLITFAAELWKHKGTRGAIEPALRMVTGNRYRALDYFDLRWVLGESPLSDEWGPASPALLGLDSNSIQSGEDGQTQYGADPYRFYSATGDFVVGHEEGRPLAVLDGTSAGLYTVSAVISANELETEQPFPAAETTRKWRLGWWSDQYTTEVRVVDEASGAGQINRTYLRDLLALLKPENERIRIVYLDFFDNFLVENDLDQWLLLSGSRPVVADGVMTMAKPVQIATVDRWDEGFVLTVRCMLTSEGVVAVHFLRQDAVNYYYIFLESGTKSVHLDKVVGGGHSAIAQADVDLHTQWWHVVKIQCIRNYGDSKNYFKIYFDGNLEIEASSGESWVDGAVGLHAQTADADIDFVELLRIGADVEQVGLVP
jgi:hypothetical protein